MEQDLYTYVQTRLQAIHPRSEWKAIAEAAGVPEGTLYRYAHGYTPRPSYTPLAAIAAVLRQRADR
jgi:transcriptional regulator with XRE-family HTH domain